MKTITVAATLAALASLAQATVPGFDISGYQPNVNWNAVKASGKKFVYIKATESTSKPERTWSFSSSLADKPYFQIISTHLSIHNTEARRMQA